MNPCKRCGHDYDIEAVSIPGYCLFCVQAIVLEWEAAQDRPINFDVAELPVS